MLERKPQDYRYFSVNDFLLDEYFQQWVQSPDEVSNQFWKAFLQQYPQQKDTLAEAQDILSTIRFKPYVLSEDKKKKYLEAIYKDSPLVTPEKLPIVPLRQPHSPIHYIFKKYKGLAAVISTILIVAAVIYLYLGYQKFEIYATDFGETKTFTLTDGTIVKLNANSKIMVNIDLEKDQPREVCLTGEAYFEVAEIDSQEENQRFIVHTEELEVEVLGTEFNVNSREEKTQVILDKGSVKVSGHDLLSSIIMQPGEMVELSKNEKEIRRNQVKAQNYTSWKDQMFIFDNTPLLQVAKEIETYYGVKVQFEDQALANKLFSVSGVPRKDLTMLLSLIEESFSDENIEVQKEKNLVIIRNKNNQHMN